MKITITDTETGEVTESNAVLVKDSKHLAELLGLDEETATFALNDLGA